MERSRKKSHPHHGVGDPLGALHRETKYAQLKRRDGARSLMLVRGLLSDGRVRLSHVEDARRLKLPDMFRCTVNQLMSTYKARKVEVTILSELIACGA